MWKSRLASEVLADLGHQDLDLHRLHLVGEDVAEHLGVGVGQAWASTSSRL
jgi:hypothetical protein